MEITAHSLSADRAAIESAGHALAARAEAGWDDPVPTCPKWDVGALLVHTSGAQRWATANLTAGERVRASQMPPPPGERKAQTAWYADGLTALLEAADSIDPYAEVWTFSPTGEHRSAWWLRRMAQETSVHAWDAAAALGPSPAPLDARLAASGIEEYVIDYLPRLPAETWDGWKGTLHVHATDADAEWVLDLDDMTQPALRGHAKADTAVRGRASDLLLWLWNRQPATGLEVFGDASLLTRWRQVTI
jgi:uncharacterized protein (TIGR03083 family)